MSAAMAHPAILEMHDADRELIRLCQQAVVAFQEARTFAKAGTELMGPSFDRNWARSNARSAVGRRLARRIAKMQAHSMTGIRARAAAIQAAMQIDFGIGDSIPIDWHHGMLDTLLRDLVGRES